MPKAFTSALRTSIWPVTTSAMSRVRYSLINLIWRLALFLAESNLSVSRSK